MFCVLISTIAFGLSESTGPGGSNAQAVHALGYNGQEVHIGFISVDNIRINHEAFFEKDANNLPTGTQHAFIHDVIGDGTRISNHDTNLAGIVVSSGGQTQPDQIGVAPMAYLHNVRVSDNDDVFSGLYLQDALDELIVNQNCRGITTGFQLPEQGDGDSVWALIYDYYAQEYDVIFANAAGNYSSSYPDVVQISVFGDAYNGITTAGLINTDSTAVYDKVGSLSLYGPTDDGRNKPDISAPSPYQTVPSSASDTSWTTVVGTTQGYTSWSIPHTVGVAALLLSYADSTTTEADDGHSEVIKAVIVNSAFPNIQDEYGISTTGQVWNNYRGHGRLDALKAYEILSEGKILPDTDETAQKGWAYQIMTKNYQIETFRLYGQKNERLVLTVTWHRNVTYDLFSGYSEESSPQFNLDISIQSPQGTSLFSETDTLNNLQKADIVLPEDGFYEITLTNTTNKKDRSYALAFELLPPLEADVNVDSVVDSDDMTDLASYWLETNCENPSADCYGYDLSPNGKIDLSDFAVLVKNWLTYDSRYYTP